MLVPHPSPEKPPAANYATAVPPPLFSLTGAWGPLSVAAAEEATSLGRAVWLVRLRMRLGLPCPSGRPNSSRLFSYLFVCFISQFGI